MIASTKDKKKQKSQKKTENLFGSELNFAAKEAYKLLRTNLMFALSDTDETKGRIIGITSALRGEGKSTTALNLASVLAEQGMKVLVIDGDLRLPSLHHKLKLRAKLGLSNVLISRTESRNYILEYEVGKIDGRPVCFDVLPAGEIPPNPSELLGSRRMKDTLETLKTKYEFVLLDLPPITAVSDALVVTKMVDGVVMVVRNEYSDTGSLNEAIRQLKQVDGKILGFVFTCADGGRSGYRKKYKYRYYNYAEYK